MNVSRSPAGSASGPKPRSTTSRASTWRRLPSCASPAPGTSWTRIVAGGDLARVHDLREGVEPLVGDRRHADVRLAVLAAARARQRREERCLAARRPGRRCRPRAALGHGPRRRRRSRRDSRAPSASRTRRVASDTVYEPSSASNENAASRSPASARSNSSAVSSATSTDSTCWPSKAISIRMRSGSAIAHELCQNSAGRLRMDERDLQPEEPAARGLVDQACTGPPQPLELGADVGDLERNVVQAWASLRQEPPDRRLGPQGSQELDPPGAGTQRDGVDTLLLEAVAMLDLRLEQPRIRLDRLRRDRRPRSRRGASLGPFAVQDRVDELALPLALDPFVLDEVRPRGASRASRAHGRSRCFALRCGRSRGGARDLRRPSRAVVSRPRSRIRCRGAADER